MKRPASLHVLVGAACRTLLTADVARVTPLSEAATSDVCRVRLVDGESVIVKLWYGASQRRANKERQVFEAVHSSKLVNTAEVMGYGRLAAYAATAVITSDLKGQSLAQLVDAGQLQSTAALRLIGVLLARFHRLSMPLSVAAASMTLADLVASQLAVLRREGFAELAQHVAPGYQHLIDRAPVESVWCHGDLHPSNVIVAPSTGGKLALHLVDFESTVCCVPEYDIAKSVVTGSSLSRRDRDEVVRSASRRRPVADDLIDTLIVFHAVDGWLYAAQLEGRDRKLWNQRLGIAMTSYRSSP